MTKEKAIELLDIIRSVEGDIIVDNELRDAIDVALQALSQQEQTCDTCTNDKGCVTCKDGELWEGKEQPSEDLEAEMRRFLANVTPSFKDGSYRITRYGFRAVARHFYELGKQAKKEE